MGGFAVWKRTKTAWDLLRLCLSLCLHPEPCEAEANEAEAKAEAQGAGYGQVVTGVAAGPQKVRD